MKVVWKSCAMLKTHNHTKKESSFCLSQNIGTFWLKCRSVLLETLRCFLEDVKTVVYAWFLVWIYTVELLCTENHESKVHSFHRGITGWFIDFPCECNLFFLVSPFHQICCSWKDGVDFFVKRWNSWKEPPFTRGYCKWVSYASVKRWNQIRLFTCINLFYHHNHWIVIFLQVFQPFRLLVGGDVFTSFH